MTIKEREIHIRKLCQERGIDIVKRGTDAWWLVGSGVSMIVKEIGDVKEAELKPQSFARR